MRRVLIAGWMLALLFIALGCKNGPTDEDLAAANTAPVADAGVNQTATGPMQSVALDGRGSYDPEGDTIWYSWTIDAAPYGSTLENAVQPFTPNNDETGTTSFTPDVSGTYVIGLTVTDGLLTSNMSYTIIDVGDNGYNDLPTAVAGPDQTVEAGTVVTLDGSLSTHPSGLPLTYLWTMDYGPSHSSIFNFTADTAVAAFTPDVDGDFIFWLTVTGPNTLLPDIDEVIISVSTPGRPVADAGQYQSAQVNTPVTLNGSASYDPDGSPLTFNWTALFVPVGSTAALSDPASATPSFTPDLTGNYTFQLTVNDGTLTSSPEIASVSVGNIPFSMIDFTWSPPASFTMGSEFSGGDGDEYPVHEVTLTRGFSIGKREVTQAQWTAVMGTNPSSDQGDNLPVANVTFADVQLFIETLNTQNGMAGCTLADSGCFYLPTEAEWEFAAKARSEGALFRYPGSNDANEVAWYYDNSMMSVNPVGMKLSNGMGLYDMGGGVAEWVADWYGPYTADAASDPAGPSTGTERVTRGGSRLGFSSDVTVSARKNVDPTMSFSDLGFRIAKVP